MQSHLFFAFRMLKKTISCATCEMAVVRGPGRTALGQPSPGPGLTILNGRTSTGKWITQRLVVSKHIQDINFFTVLVYIV